LAQPHYFSLARAKHMWFSCFALRAQVVLANLQTSYFFSDVSEFAFRENVRCETDFAKVLGLF